MRMQWLVVGLLAGNALWAPTAAQAAATRWLPVDSTPGYVLSIDQESARLLPRGVRDVWFVRMYRSIQTDTTVEGKPYHYIREAWLYHVDCQKREIGHQERILYAPSGRVVHKMNFADPALAQAHMADLRPVAPETEGELLLTAACRLKLER
jgi:Surface-adhesin protein E